MTLLHGVPDQDERAGIPRTERLGEWTRTTDDFECHCCAEPIYRGERFFMRMGLGYCGTGCAREAEEGRR